MGALLNTDGAPALSMADRIRAMSYNELIGLVRETNRPPGGLSTVAEIARAAGLRPGSRVLEIGCATGYTALELASLSGCDVIGIDINPQSVAEAERRARAEGADTVRFQVADAGALPFPDGAFDLIMCGNVTSLVSDRERAVAEYVRVLRPRGFLAATPMYYVDTPPDGLVEAVRAAIQVRIPVHYRDQALELYRGLPLAPGFEIDRRFDDVPPQAVDIFCDTILARRHLAELDAPAREVLNALYRRHMHLFRDNLALMGFTILLLRKLPEGEDPELFTASPAR
jgi:SAM-dependent methyltransferase